MTDLFTLSRWPLPYVRVSCKKCDRAGKLSTARLIEKHGEDIDMFSLREAIAAGGCGRDQNKGEFCTSELDDAFLVDAILEPNESQVLRPALLPEARAWREKLGIDLHEFKSEEAA